MSAFGDLPRHAKLEITSRSANIVICSADVPAPTVVRGRAEIDAAGVVRLRGESEVEIHCPPGTDVCVASSSGKVTCKGLLGRVFASSRSGDVTIEQAESIDVRTASARVDIGTCAGACEVVGHSGRIEIGAAGRASVSTASGRTTIDSAGDATVRSASGAVHVGARPSGVIDVATLSGSVKIQLAEGCNPAATLHTMSGKVRAPDRGKAATGGDLRVRTMSGSITIE